MIPPGSSAQPGGLVGEQAERGGVRLRETKLREAEIFWNTRSAAASGRPAPSAPAMNSSLSFAIASRERLRLIARRRLSACPALKPASAIATWSTCSW